MKRIVVLGAGKSTSVLIRFLLDQAEARDWQLVVADRDRDLAAARIAAAPPERASASGFDVTDEAEVARLIGDADAVISMVPASLHAPVARACVRHRAHFISASYISPEVRALHD
ncbi:MAG: saccharopine dehydrogenase NADP-binding domain-containing protein, partial [Myxococcota bacterium]